MLVFLMLAHAVLGEGPEAAVIAARLRAEFPGFSIEGFISGYPVSNLGAAQAMREAAKLVPIR
ncbi:hypothetical protein [Mesorhizobium sp. M2C.T.Ca.TU.002.02.1.1]|uniref:hypothetical protein n=1 Tax=Mesorhizobium sp. M2C.T.Ca.TU.002.02.1.1 TaxID=2496788 RepID=UPI001FDFEE52|nr:hypothetical protein [Mesorhizobium sp. M2C.T.Ca.TU.002.02.1.1]